MKLALAGDTMLSRGVAKKLSSSPPESLFAPELVEIAQVARDLLCAHGPSAARRPSTANPHGCAAEPSSAPRREPRRL